MITLPTLITLGVKNTFTGVWAPPPSMIRILAVTLSSGFVGRFAAADDESDQAAGAAPRTPRATVTPTTARHALILRDRSRSRWISIDSATAPIEILAAA